MSVPSRWALASAALAIPTTAHAQTAQQDAARTAAPLPRDSDVPNPSPQAQADPAPAPPPVDHEALVPKAMPRDPLNDQLIPGRRRPGARRPALGERVTQDNPGAVAPPPLDAFPTDEFPVPDRWRLLATLCPDRSFRGVQAACRGSFDPYHQNTLKGDRPLCHATPEEQRRRREARIPRCLTPGFLREDDWFLQLGAVSDTVVEPRSFPLPVGVQTTDRPDSNDLFGRASSFLFVQQVTATASLFKGSTAFMPPHVEYRVALTYSYNYADVSERRILSVRPSAPTHRHDAFLGVQELFVDYHLRDVSERYDFDSIRVGIQPFNADFRGFLFSDSQPGIRLFGNRDNNRWQYNLAAFVRLEKDSNSGLNDVSQSPRKSYLLFANLYRQDFPFPSFTSQLAVAHERNRERAIEVDHNGFPVRPALLGDLRPRTYDVTYLGYSGDGHVDRLNLTVSGYVAVGQDRNSFFTSRSARIRAFFLAAEPSYDVDWLRLRLSGVYASGDGDPYDDREGGFDAISENPLIAGADTSYWIRQSVPFIGGGRAIGVNGRNGLLADLRSSKDQGQSNFNNPGFALAGAGFDADLLTSLRLSGSASHLWFAKTQVLQALRHEGSIPATIGWDLSTAATWRPQTTQNIVLRLSAAVLLPGKGARDLFSAGRDRDGGFYSVLANAILSF